MTTQPITNPQRLGEPCWTAESMATAIRVIAQLDPTKAGWFLASHAPIRHLLDTKTSRLLSEASAYTLLSQAKDREVEVLVKGEPGTGKSHFVNWLKICYDREIETGQQSDIIPVLVQRRTGSLKDALDQLVSQLPPAFTSYLDPIRAAIGRISADEARERLAHFISQELGIRWREANRAPRSRRLRSLEEVFSSQGFRQWLCRGDGAIWANIARLTNPSDVRDREAVPHFSEAEFHILDARARTENTPTVLELIDTFDDDEKWRHEAAECVNGVLRDALREMTGLGEGQLSAIFRRIRADLQVMGKRLVLLIEDVSTLSVLDSEILNVLEPQNDPSLCPLTSVVGMTFAAYERLRKNETDRASYIWSLGSASETHWRDSANVLDQFAGRYLNTVRLAPAAVQRLGEDRMHGADVSMSACDGCRVRESCHGVFGSTQFGETVVGLFPLRPGTTSKLIQNLDVAKDGVERTPRGLLVNILKPMLTDVLGLSQGHEALLMLPVVHQHPAYWTAFENQYCSDWSSDDRRCLRMLAVYWTSAKDSDEAAGLLAPLLKPFGLPAIVRSKGRSTTPIGPVVNPQPPREQTPAEPIPPPRNAAGEAKLEALRGRLEEWIDGSVLTTPAEAQELLYGLLSNGLPFEETRTVSRSARRLVRDSGTIAIEGAATRSVTSAFKFHFPRSQETQDLILALAHHRYLGNSSWVYPDAEIHKRIVSTWLRRNGAAMLASLNEKGIDPRRPVYASARFLAIGYMAHTRKSLPLESADAVEAIFKFSVASPPTALSEPLSKLYRDLPERVKDVQGVLMAELDVPQGTTGGINFIDPDPVLIDLPAMRRGELPDALGSEYLAGYSQSRFAKLASLIEGDWSRLTEAVSVERHAFTSEVGSIYSLLSREGLDPDDLKGSIMEYLDKALELRRALLEIRQIVHCPRFEAIASTLGIRKESTAKHIVDAAVVSTSEDVRGVVIFDTDEFLKSKEILLATAEFITAVRAEAGAGDPVLPLEEETRARDGAITALEEFVRVSADE